MKIDIDNLLKRADNFNSLSDGISGHNRVTVDLVKELAAGIRDLEMRIQFAVEFVEDAKAGDAAVSWDAEALISYLTRSKTFAPIVRNREYAKRVATEFYYWWHNQPGTNTEQGFEEFWREFRMKEMGITNADLQELGILKPEEK